ELSFVTRHVSQHCMQPLWSQYNESEHNHKRISAPRPAIHPLVRLWSLAMATVTLGFSSSVFIADLKPRMPSPIPLPSSGSFLGPNTSRAVPKVTNRCIG